jgi:uncharacterized protein (DUF362 family)
MTKDRTRRWFLKTSAAAGASVGLGTSVVTELLSTSPVFGADHPDLTAIAGSDPFTNTVAAVDKIGGMSRFVAKGSRVAINANTSFKLPGSNVEPAVILATVKMCFDAGAEEVKLVKPGKPGYWERTPRFSEFGEMIEMTEISEHDFKVVKVPNGVALKEAHVDSLVLDSDVYLNVSVVKDHAGTGFTGALKTAMGFCPHRPTNSFCHFGSAPPDRENFYANVDHLSQCIADPNLIRKPDLCLVDATAYLKTNGPAGPGDLGRADTVVAATDPVTIDAYSTRFVDLLPEEVKMIGMAQRLGVGEADLQQIRIIEGTSA